MLGKLCKLMRLCGIDTEYSNQGMKILLEARRQGRIILTRNQRLSGYESVFFVQPLKPSLQFREIIEKFNLADELVPFSRCLICNEKLQPINKEIIKNRIPYFTYKNFNEFALCKKCQRVYWKGSHYQNMLYDLEKTLGKKIV